LKRGRKKGWRKPIELVRRRFYFSISAEAHARLLELCVKCRASKSRVVEALINGAIFDTILPSKDLPYSPSDIET